MGVVASTPPGAGGWVCCAAMLRTSSSALWVAPQAVPCRLRPAAAASLRRPAPLSTPLQVHRGVYEAAQQLYDRFLPLITDHLATSPFAKVGSSCWRSEGGGATAGQM